MAKEKKNNLNGGPLPPLPNGGGTPPGPEGIDSPVSGPPIPDFHGEDSLPLPEFAPLPSAEPPAMPSSPFTAPTAAAGPSVDYEKKFQEIEQARINMVKMLEEIQDKHTKEKHMWESKIASLEKESQVVLDDFASRQLKEDEQRAKMEEVARNEKIKLEKSLKELESKLEEAREKAFIQALKTKDEETTSLKLEAAMKDVKLKNAHENAAREIEAVKSKLSSDLSAKLLLLQKQYESKLADIYVKSSQKEKVLIEKVDNLQQEKESTLKQADHEKESMRREFNSKNMKAQNEINLLVSRLDETKENYTKSLMSLQGELASAKAQAVADIANIKSEYEGRLDQLKKVSSELEGKIVTLNSELESEKKIASENIRFKDEKITALQKQFADREKLLKDEFENRITQSNSDKNRIESELLQSLEKTRQEYSHKIAAVQDEKKAIEQEILIRKSEFEKRLRELSEEQNFKIDELEKEYENKLRDKDIWQQKTENEHNIKVNELKIVYQRDVDQLKENINIINQHLLQERAKYENLISEKDKEIVAVKSTMQSEIEKQKKFYEGTILFKEEKIEALRVDFEKRELIARSDFEKRLKAALDENISLEIRFRTEIENLSSEFTKRLSASLEEKGKIEQDFHFRIAFIEKEHLKEFDLLRERHSAEIERQRQEFQKKLDISEDSKNKVEQKHKFEIENRVAEFEKDLKRRDGDWNLRIDSLKNSYENRIKQVESEKVSLQQDIQKRIEETDNKWLKKLKDEKGYFEERIAGFESERNLLQKEMKENTERINDKWLKKLEEEKMYLEERIARLSSEFESRKKQLIDENERYKTAVSAKENELTTLRNNYESRIAEMSRNENNLKDTIEKISDDLKTEHKKFLDEIALKTKEFESKMESHTKAKQDEIRNIQRAHNVELKTISIDNESRIAELKNEILEVQKEKDSIYNKWMEEKKQWVNESIRKSEELSSEERTIALKKAELEALELKLKMNEKTVDERVDAAKRSYNEMYEAKSGELEFLKEQLKKTEEETNEKMRQAAEAASTYEKVIKSKNEQLEFMKEQLVRMEKDIEEKIEQAVQSASSDMVNRDELVEKEKELTMVISENKMKEEKILALQEDMELKLKEKEEKYKHECETIKTIAMKSSARHLEDIRKMREEIDRFENANAGELQKAVAEIKKEVSVEQPTAPAKFKESVFVRIWHWLNGPV